MRSATRLAAATSAVGRGLGSATGGTGGFAATGGIAGAGAGATAVFGAGAKPEPEELEELPGPGDAVPVATATAHPATGPSAETAASGPQQFDIDQGLPAASSTRTGPACQALSTRRVSSVTPSADSSR